MGWFTNIVSKIFAKWKVCALGLSSMERDALGASVNEGLFFSAHVSDAELLAEIQNYINSAIEGKDWRFEKEYFMERIRERFALSADLRGEGEISQRLNLLWEQNVGRAEGKAQRLSAVNANSLLTFPYWEFLRIEPRKEPRDWITRWASVGGTFAKGMRMIAPITSDIWVRLSRFGTPYPPFDYNSGMGVEELSRSEGDELLVFDPEDEEF